MENVFTLRLYSQCRVRDHIFRAFFLILFQVRELLSQKLSSWQQSCSQPTKLPERALNLLRHTAPQSPGAAGVAEVLRHTKIGSSHPEQVRSCLFMTAWVIVVIFPLKMYNLMGFF